MSRVSRITHHISPILLSACWLLHSAVLLAAEPSPLRLGLLLPPEETDTNSLRQGAQLAVDLANKSGEPAVGLVIRGRPGQWGDDGTEAARMVLDDGVRGLIAPAGGAPSHLAMQVSGRTATPLVSLCADTSVTGPMVPWMVRIVPSNLDEAGTILAAVKPAQPGQKFQWGAFIPDGRPGREAASDLLKAANKAGCELAKTIEVSVKSTNFAALAAEMLRASPSSTRRAKRLPDSQLPTLNSQLTSAPPQAILLWLDPEPAGRLAKALRASGFAGILAGPERLRSAGFLAGAGEAAEGFITPHIVTDQKDEETFRRFANAYRTRYHDDPDPTAAFAFDAATLLIDILRKSGSESPYRAFPLDKPVPGASGTLRFDQYGNRIIELKLQTARRGQFVDLDRSKQ